MKIISKIKKRKNSEESIQVEEIKTKEILRINSQILLLENKVEIFLLKVKSYDNELFEKCNLEYQELKRNYDTSNELLLFPINNGVAINENLATKTKKATYIVRLEMLINNIAYIIADVEFYNHLINTNIPESEKEIDEIAKNILEYIKEHKSLEKRTLNKAYEIIWEILKKEANNSRTTTFDKLNDNDKIYLLNVIINKIKNMEESELKEKLIKILEVNSSLKIFV